MRAEIEDEHPAAWNENAVRLDERPRRILGVMQRLREQGDIDRAVADGQTLELAAFPDDVAHATARGKRARPLQHRVRTIDRNDAAGPAARFDRQVALAAAEIGDTKLRQQVPQRTRPRCPTPARHELAFVGIRTGMRVEILFSQTPDFFQPCIVHSRQIAGGRCERAAEEIRQRRAVGAFIGQRRREPEERVAALAALADEIRFLQQAEMA